jgi:hypothetical protein
MDEYSITLGVCANLYVLRLLEKKRLYVKLLESRKWVLIIKVISLIRIYNRRNYYSSKGVSSYIRGIGGSTLS